MIREFFRYAVDRVGGWLRRPILHLACLVHARLWQIAEARRAAIHFCIREAITAIAVMTFIWSAVVLSDTLPFHPAWGRHVFAAAAATVLIMLAYVLRRLLDAEKWRDLHRRLDAPCRADNDPFYAAVEIRGTTRFDRDNFVADCREIPIEAENILLLLPQTQKRWWNTVIPYTIESMNRQLEALKQHDEARFKKIGWVCFVTSAGTFVAYQSMKKFLAEMRKRNANYADILNKQTPAEFRKAITDEIDEETKLKNGEAAKANTIPGLETGLLCNLPLSKKEAVFLLQSGDRAESMLVSAEEHKPIGIVTLKRLLQETVTKGILSATDRKALEKKIESQTKTSDAAIANAEADNRPQPARDHGDDSTERDALAAEPVCFTQP